MIPKMIFTSKNPIENEKSSAKSLPLSIEILGILKSCSLLEPKMKIRQSKRRSLYAPRTFTTSPVYADVHGFSRFCSFLCLHPPPIIPKLCSYMAWKGADELVMFRLPIFGDLAEKWVEEENE